MSPDPRLQICALCPKLCRHVCPVAVATGREAATPTHIMTSLLRWSRGELPDELAAQAATLCTDCGACERSCGVDQPVMDMLRVARQVLCAPLPTEPLQAVQGGATFVAIECDSRRWAEALSTQIGRGVARLSTTDHLSSHYLEHPESATEHLIALRDRLGGRTAIVCCHSCGRTTTAAGIETIHLHRLVPMPVSGNIHHPCHGPRLEGDTPPEALACCGAAGPLSREHRDSAADLRAQAAVRLGPGPACSVDARCAQHLASDTLTLLDPISHLLSLSTA